MEISEQGLELIKSSEGCELTAYQDSVGVWTIGFGHTGSDVTPNTVWTQDQADKALQNDLETVYKCIANSVKVEMTQGQFDALCSFVFNLGCIALRNSTLLRMLNSGDDVGASEQFSRWSHAGGIEQPGLLARREKEAALFMA